MATITSCNPYAAINPTASPPPAATITADIQEKIADSATPTPRPACMIATGYQEGTVNFRAGPTTSAAVVGVLSEGEAVTVIERGAWLKVIASNRTGYIYSKFCK